MPIVVGAILGVIVAVIAARALKRIFNYYLIIETCTGSKLAYKISRITGGWHKKI